MKGIYSGFILVFFSSFVFSTTPAKFNNGLIGFIENKGQIHDQNNKPTPEVKYLLCTAGINVQLKTNSFSYDSYSIEERKKEIDPLDKRKKDTENIYHFHRVDVEFIGSNTTPEIISEGASLNSYNYYTVGLNDQGIRANSFSKITYKNLYPNIDLEFVTSVEKVKYNFILHSGADISQIKWQYKGAENTELKEEKISIKVAQGSFYETIPESFFTHQNSKSKKKIIKINYKKSASNVYGYDSQKTLKINSGETLTIDPTLQLLWATYYGGNGDEWLWNVCSDQLGNTYYSGTSASTNAMASTGAYQVTYGGGAYDAIVIKFDPSGNRIWGTYYGGYGDDEGYGLTIDKSNNLYLSGLTTSTISIATIGSHQTNYGGGVYDVFLVKLTSSGSIVWGTYYGGSGDDRSFFCHTDTLGNVYLSGATSSTNSISTPGSHQVTYGGGTYDGFLAKFNTNGVRQWATYYGGTGEDAGQSPDVDYNNNVYLTGYTKSTLSISTSGSHQFGYGGGEDIFLVKFNSNGVRKWGTYSGGSGNDVAVSIACDSLGYVYITGTTNSKDSISTLTTHQPIYGGCNTSTGCYGDAFLIKFDSIGVRQWGTYYGGNRDEGGYFCLTKGPYVYMCGTTMSGSAIATPNTYQLNNPSLYVDMMLVKFTSSGARLWGTYFGANFGDFAYGMVIDPFEYIYLCGENTGNFLVTAGAYQTTPGNASTTEGAILKFRELAISTGFEESHSALDNLNIFPNPFNNKITIVSNGTKQNVQVFDIRGSLVYNSSIENEKNEIDLSKQPPGIYFIKIGSLTRKIIKE
jgi:hypothetical protein